jgi:predicted amidohydrolase YtcJ
VLKKYSIGPDHPAPGVGFDLDGQPNGELREAAAMALAKDEYRTLAARAYGPKAFTYFAQTMRNAGITTSSDLASTLLVTPHAFVEASATSAADEFPLRIAAASFINASRKDLNGLVDAIAKARRETHDKLLFPVVKLVLDGSIQGFTATVGWPGYFDGEAHPLFVVPPEQVTDILRPFHEAHIGIHCHCNGDQAAQVFIDAIESLLSETPWMNHRHTITHAQLMTQAQMRTARNLGMCANFFINHVWYWGDQHREITVGPDRADGLDPCATADRHGLPYSIHCDAPVTPPSQLHTMWAAVNRVTPSGRVLGEHERISVDRAFQAVTIDAAYQLHLDHVIGSLEVGKFADMTVLQEDPFAVDPINIRDITIWGTIIGGVIHQNPTH